MNRIDRLYNNMPWLTICLGITWVFSVLFSNFLSIFSIIWLCASIASLGVVVGIGTYRGNGKWFSLSYPEIPRAGKIIGLVNGVLFFFLSGVGYAVFKDGGFLTLAVVSIMWFVFSLVAKTEKEEKRTTLCESK
jgi:FtsH-binding integral membrane protein